MSISISKNKKTTLQILTLYIKMRFYLVLPLFPYLCGGVSCSLYTINTPLVEMDKNWYFNSRNGSGFFSFWLIPIHDSTDSWLKDRNHESPTE